MERVEITIKYLETSQVKTSKSTHTNDNYLFWPGLNKGHKYLK